MASTRQLADILLFACVNSLTCLFVYGQNTNTTTVTQDTISQTNSSVIGAPGGEQDKGSPNTTGVVVAAVIAVALCVIIVIAVYIIKKRRETRMMDKEKKMQIQMSSARNAGVYQDLTVSVPADEKLHASPEHERLRGVEDA